MPDRTLHRRTTCTQVDSRLDESHTSTKGCPIGSKQVQIQRCRTWERTVAGVTMHAVRRILCYAPLRGDFHCASQYLTIVHLPRAQQHQQIRRLAALLLTRANRCCVCQRLSYPSQPTDCAHCQLSNWLQCTLTNNPARDYTRTLLLESELNPAEIETKRLRGSDSFAN